MFPSDVHLINKRVGLLAAVWLIACGVTHAQLLPSMGDPAGVNPAFLTLLAGAGNFTATADTLVLDAAGKEWARLPMAASFATNSLRLDIQINEVKSRDLPEFMAESLTAAGMGKISALILPEKAATYLIYPGFQCYLHLPLSPAEAMLAKARKTMEKTPLGTEVVDGKTCNKQRVQVKGGGRNLLEAITWESPDSKGVPARVEVTEPGRKMVLTFRNVHFAPPNAKEFELPQGFKEYSNAQAMTFGIMKRIAGTSDAK